jgi:phospho-N-acetylmuramoyl-pentapeptide-transferase
VSAKTKLVWQFAVAIAVSYIFAYGLPNGVTYDNQAVSYRSLYIPFFKEPLILDMGFFAVIFFSFMIVGFSNAVNLTDGLDGLASGCSISTGLAYAGFCYLASNINFAKFLLIPYFSLADELTIVAMALVGACFGFLWFNCQPARMFMGDTGSLALGGAIPTLAIGCKQELILLIVGGVFVMEAGSVMLQVASFKTRKVRIFRMAPIHHHFELGGWQESQVVVRFWMMSLIMALIGLATLKLR